MMNNNEVIAALAFGAVNGYIVAWVRSRRESLKRHNMADIRFASNNLIRKRASTPTGCANPACNTVSERSVITASTCAANATSGITCPHIALN